MNYSKRKFVLKGKNGSWAILVFEGYERISFYLEKSSAPMKGDLLVFWDENRFERYNGLEGHMAQQAARPERIQGVCLLVEGEFALTGGSSRMDWEKARTAYRLEEQRAAAFRLRQSDPAIPSEELAAEQQNAVNPPAEEQQEAALPPDNEYNEKIPDAPLQEEEQAPEGDVQKRMPPEEEASIRQSFGGEQTMKEETSLGEVSAEAAAAGTCLTPRVRNISPFPYLFSESEWVRVEYPFSNGQDHYLSGKIYIRGELVATAMAVPGRYAITPPPWLKGFDIYLNEMDGTGGYWVLLRDARTGRTTTVQSLFR